MNNDNTNRDEFWRKNIRELRPMIAKLVNDYNKRNNNCLNEDDIDDILQESVIVLYEKTVDPTFNLTVKSSTYIYSVAENKVREKIRKLKKININSYDDTEEDNLIVSDEYDKEKDKKDDWRLKILKECINLLNKTQKKIFTEFYYHKKSMEDLAEDLNSTIRTMISQKYKATISVKQCVKTKN
jgi:RNA polymerase sigma factor (sigma-70 family)